MDEHSQRMLQAFIEYELRMQGKLSQHALVGFPLGTRALRLIRLSYGWRLWSATADYVYGTYWDIHDNGMIIRYTIRADEGDEEYLIRPSDDEIRNMQHD